MSEYPTISGVSVFSPHGPWSDHNQSTTDSLQPSLTHDSTSAFEQAAESCAARAPFLSAFGLGERHSRCSTPCGHIGSCTSHDSAFLKPRVKMLRCSESHASTENITDFATATTDANNSNNGKLLSNRQLSGSRTPLTATSSDVLNRSDSSQPLIPDASQWGSPASVTRDAGDASSAAASGRRTEIMPLPRVVSSPNPTFEFLGGSLGCDSGSTQSLSSAGGASLSRCRRKMQSLTRPAFDLGRIEKQQDRDPSFLSEVCNAAECHPISEISSFLCLGTWKDAGDEALLRRHRIKYVLNVAKELHDEHGACRPPTPEGAYGEFISFSIPMRDCHDEKLTQNLSDAFDFIERARCENSRVLVHCRRGISRSAAIVVAYLMASEGRAYDDAYAFVRERRSCVSLNLAFQEMLSEYMPDSRWRHSAGLRGLVLEAPEPSTSNGDEEHQGCGETPPTEEVDSLSRDSFNDEVMLLDEETSSSAAPFSPLTRRTAPMCFHSPFDTPSAAPTATAHANHLASPFAAQQDKHQSQQPVSPFV